MKTRQATKRMLILLTLLSGLQACAPANQLTPTLTHFPTLASRMPTQTLTPSPTANSPTITAVSCRTGTSVVNKGTLDSTKPPQEYLIYLPPCYHENPNNRYPVLYLLHGQTYTDNQWIRIGAVKIVSDLIRSGQSQPFIIVFPDDRYWNLPAGSGFGERLVDHLIPYIDETYRTIPDRDHRAIGGMSRGAGWALRLGLTRWDLFASIGLHSLAVFKNDASQIPEWLAEIPSASRPRVFMDIGDNDQELEDAQQVEEQFNESGLSHEWHLYSGAHTEEYWSAHVEEYMQWYAEGWTDP